MSGDKVRQRVWPILAPKKYSDTALQGISIHRPIIYGNSAVLLSDEEKERAPKDHTHRWTVAVRSPAPGRDADTVGGGDDLSYFIKKVSFKLHDTYPNPTRSEPYVLFVVAC
jgi:YEATS domain-containing protein 4